MILIFKIKNIKIFVSMNQFL